MGSRQVHASRHNIFQNSNSHLKVQILSLATITVSFLWQAKFVCFFKISTKCPNLNSYVFSAILSVKCTSSAYDGINKPFPWDNHCTLLCRTVLYACFPLTQNVKKLYTEWWNSKFFFFFFYFNKNSQ